MTEFLDSSRDRRRWAEDGVRGLQTSLKALAKRGAEVKRGYEARAREEIQANHAYHQVSGERRLLSRVILEVESECCFTLDK